MKDNNPHRQHIPLYCTPPSQTEHDYEGELHHFPPVRVRTSPPLPHSLPRVRAAQKITYKGEDELSDFPSIKVGNDAPLFSPNPGRSDSHPPGAAQMGSQQLPLPSKSEGSRLQRRQKPNKGLGNINILNTVNPAAPVQVIPYSLYR